MPLTFLFGAGIVYAAKFGYDRASSELLAIPNPTAGNETFSEPFLFDPGDDPIVLAIEKAALRNQLSIPPGSEGSGTTVVSAPMLLRIIERDLGLARVIVIGGDLDGRRFWARADRLNAAKRGNN